MVRSNPLYRVENNRKLKFNAFSVILQMLAFLLCDAILPELAATDA
jgi:hypothetical protein